MKQTKRGMPAHVKVGHRIYSILAMPEQAILDDRLCGQHYAMLQKIFIREDGHPRSEVANTLLHEVLHAVFDIYLPGEHADEERLVDGIANGLCAVFRDNPGFLQWLGDSLED